MYISGQLSDIPEKSVEPIAINAGVPPRTLQEFLSQHHWDEDRARDRLQQIVRDEHAGPHSIGILDETSDVKKGDKTPGVQRQWCGAVGKKENCIVTVHLSYARDGFHTLLDGELYLPKSWSDDRDRCREAGIPDDMVYRPKWKIGLELLRPRDRQRPALRLDDLRRGLRQQARIPPGTLGPQPAVRGRGAAQLHGLDQGTAGRHPSVPQTRPRPRPQDAPAGQRQPAVATGRRDARSADGFRNQPWVKWRVKDGHKGPMVWEVKHLRFYPVGDDGLPGEPLHLIVARDVLNPAELKFFVSNAPAGTSVQTMLLVAFSRWRVERCFEDQKSEIGLDQYEGRRYQGLKRHLILSCVSYLFLSRMRQEFGGKNPELTECQIHTAVAALIPFWWLNMSPPEDVAGADLRRDRSERSAGTPLARKCHTKRTRQRLHALGIKLTELAPVQMGLRLSAVVLSSGFPKRLHFTRPGA